VEQRPIAACMFVTLWAWLLWEFCSVL